MSSGRYVFDTNVIISALLLSDSVPSRALREALARAVSEVMRRYQADSERLRSIYNRLVGAGAGQWASGHWVPASSIAFAFTLHYLLENEKCSDFGVLAERLVRYFENDEMGPVV